MNELKKGILFPDKIAALFQKQKGKALFLIGIAGMCLILLSAVLPAGAKENPAVGGAQQTSEAYIEQLEGRLTKIVGSVDGVGRCEVMVTAENGVEYVYAVEQSQNVNQVNSYEGDEVKKQTQQQNTEEKYIVVDAGSGKKEALLKTQKQPTIQGVVVVCEGAGSMIVQERVTQVVTTALGIPYNKVCVTKIS
ncbi:hypothetical protein [Anaerotruncus rubiinfantis]|uniref:hypothetical protein n=1 Tax=Anaerotruncus rubiinfantis TaxID=1720200 RepID=UPI000836F78E|nr:hypothetical protein [Anaerotruncus rubiinfantis]